MPASCRAPAIVWPGFAWIICPSNVNWHGPVAVRELSVIFASVDLYGRHGYRSGDPCFAAKGTRLRKAVTVAPDLTKEDLRFILGLRRPLFEFGVLGAGGNLRLVPSRPQHFIRRR